MVDENNELLKQQVSEAIFDMNEPQIKALLDDCSPAFIANILESTPLTSRVFVWPNINFELMGDVLLEIGEEARLHYIGSIEEQEIAAIIETLSDVDDQADLILDLPAEKLARTLTIIDNHKLKLLQSVLAYDVDTAGGLMDLDHITIRADVSLDVVLRYLRIRGELPEHTDQLFVTNRHDKYYGVLLIKDLLTNQTETLVSDIMLTDITPVNAETEDSIVARKFEDDDLISAPVVSPDNKLIGRITIDDVVDVIRDEGDHGIMSSAGLSEEDDLFSPIITSARRRALWLGINLLTAFLASWVISFFEVTLDQIVALAVLITIVPSMGGIAGSQTLTIVIRAMALNQLGKENYRWLLRKELAVSLLNGMVWAFIVAASTFIWFEDYRIGLIIGFALMTNLLFGAFAGALIPVFMKKNNIDPALAGGVVLTTVTDVVGILVFLGLATLWLMP